MPVQRRNVDLLMFLRSNAALPQGKEEDRQQPYDPNRDVSPVESRQCEERRAEQVRSRRQSRLHRHVIDRAVAPVREGLLEVGQLFDVEMLAIDVDVVIDELVELEDLEGQEGRPHDARREQPDPEALHIPASQRVVRQYHAHAAHKQYEGARRSRENVEHVLRERSDLTAVLVYQVRRNERAEEHAVRAQEGPHEQLLVAQTGRRIVFFVPARVGDFCVCHVFLRLVVRRRFVRLVDRFQRPRHDAYESDCPADDRRHRDPRNTRDVDSKEQTVRSD